MAIMTLIKILSTLTFAIAAEPPTVHNYRIKVPVGALTCEQEALKLGQRFRDLNQAPATSARCSGSASLTSNGNKYSFYVLDLEYTLPKKKEKTLIYSTYYGRPLMNREPNNYQGMYLSLEDCLKELPQRSDEFSNLTKMPVLASTCEKALSEYDISYTLRVDSLGTPPLKVYTTHDFGIGRVPSTWVDAIEKIVTANKGTVVNHTDNYVYYFAPAPVTPSHKSYGVFQENECKTQLNELRSVLKDKNPAELTIRCVQYPLRTMKIERLEVLLNGYQFDHHQTIPDTYGDLKECIQEKSRILAEKKQEGLNTKGAICRMTENFKPDYDDVSYKMDLYF
ncbi:MAG: hypothetical protein RJB66_2770 [Pseudomonadota bacterium]|jgi:hypothetical protein